MNLLTLVSTKTSVIIMDYAKYMGSENYDVANMLVKAGQPSLI
jgi:hypothetical protein